MKRGLLTGWSDLTSCQNLLFFAQLINELLFDFSIPSNRIPTLNSHYLCNDAARAIRSIDKQGVPEGTLKPIVEELFNSLQNDRLYRRIEQNPLRLFAKHENNKYHIVTKIDSLSYYDQKTIVTALNEKYFQNDDYLNALKENISKIVKFNNAQEQGELFQLTKSLVTELVNKGYKTNYIFNKVNTFYFSSESLITNPAVIDDFLNLFTFLNNEYTVVLLVENTVKCLIDFIAHESFSNILQPRTSSEIEAKFLIKTQNQRFLTIKNNALDPYSAVEKAKQSINHYSSIFRLSDHVFDCDLDSTRCGVYDNENNFTFIDVSVSAVRRAKTPARDQIQSRMRFSIQAIEKLASPDYSQQQQALLSAISFHALSINSTSAQNQLLDLWAIFEAILDVGKFHTSDRINQICSFLIPILKKRYIYTLFKQLSEDIRNYNIDQFKLITAGAGTENQEVQKIFEFIVLKEHDKKREEFISLCSDIPLLRERIVYFNEHMCDAQSIYQFVEKHCDRLRWQIMRIYRNRNLIIHNGEAMPYLKLLVENLHSYVDEFLEYVILNYSRGHSLNSMMLEIFTRETEWVDIFNRRGKELNREIIEFLMVE